MEVEIMRLRMWYPINEPVLSFTLGMLFVGSRFFNCASQLLRHAGCELFAILSTMPTWRLIPKQQTQEELKFTRTNDRRTVCVHAH